MFEEKKLNKYSDKFIGFAYEYISPKIDGHYRIKLYLVINNDGIYSYIKFKTHESCFDETIDQIISSTGALPLSYWISKNTNIQIRKRNNLIL